MTKDITLAELANDPGCLSEYDPNAMDFYSAQKWIAQFLTPLKQKERLPIEGALGRIIAKDIQSSSDVPNYHNSAMDGYAICFSKNGDLTFKIIGSALAGSLEDFQIKPGEALEIMTGGKIPQGASAVVPIELISIDGNSIRIKLLPKIDANIRRIGEDIAKGQVILKSGQFIRPAEIGLLASLGIGKVEVFKKLRVAYFSTGDEVIGVGNILEQGQVYDSNHYTIGAMLQAPCIETIDLHNVPDNKIMIKDTLLLASQKADLIITSGGVSVGKADFMKEVLAEIGEILFWKLAIKPGRPLAYGTIKGAHYFGLPGNPVSAMVTFYQMVKPAIRLLTGQVGYMPPPKFKAKCHTAIFNWPGRMEFQRGVLTQQDHDLVVTPTRSQGSGILSSMSEANCFIILEAEQGTIEPGDSVDVQYMDGIV